MTTTTATHKSSHRIAQYWALTKPRVTQLAVFCAVIGMFLAKDDGVPGWRLVLAATVGIWLLAGAAVAVNGLAGRETAAPMARSGRRTPRRPAARCRRWPPAPDASPARRR